jgi:hypothetical protein
MDCNLIRVGSWLLRIALAIGFLSAVADRFGLWGPPGSPGVAWGDLTRFNAYVAKLNWFMPARLTIFLGPNRAMVYKNKSCAHPYRSK